MGDRVAGFDDALDDAVADALAHGRSTLAVAGGTLALGVHGSHVLVGPLVVPGRADGRDPADRTALGEPLGDADLPAGSPEPVGADVPVDPSDAGGCAACALAWWADVSPHTAGGPPADAGLDWAPVVAEMVSRVLADPPALWRRGLLALDRETGRIGRHRFLVHPECPACAPAWRAPGPLDLDTPQPAVAGPLRTRTMDRVALREQLLDHRFGPVAHVYRDEESPLALVTAETVVPGRAQLEGGYGRSTSFAASEVPAMLEGLERVLGGYRRPTVPVTVARWNEVADRALDPRDLGEHDPALLGSGSPYEPFDPDRPTSWVWGRSTREDRPVLVPEHVAYWHENGIGARFLYESSNGCAVGGSREEAVLHGLLEVIERDAFLLAWYARARLVEVRLADDGEHAAARDLLAARGLHLRVLDLTSDFGIPVALAVVTAPEELVRAGVAPAMSLASGSAADPGRAIRVAIEECMTNALMYPKWVRMRSSVSVERCRPMLDDHDLVHTLEDHTGLHGLWEARHLSEFLDHPAGVITEAELAARPALPTDDVSRALRLLLARTHGLGMDVVVVDQGAPELTAALGVHAVKVLVPGTAPMTFGHRNRRTVGLPRLARGASILEGALPWDDDPTLNPVPHPFP